MFKSKKFLSATLALVLALTLSCTAAFAEEGNVTVTGDVQATVVSFSVPTDTSFTINPNGLLPADMFIAPEFSLTNTCSAPLTVAVSSFTPTVGGNHTFMDVSPTTYSDAEWSKLGTTASERDLALALTTNPTAGWSILTRITPLYVTDVTASTPIGTINPATSVKFSFTAKHGNAFTSVFTTKYRLVFVLGLA